MRRGLGRYKRRIIKQSSARSQEVNARYGTKKYAQIVAGRIRAFQRTWKADLQAVVVEPPKRKATKD